MALKRETERGPCLTALTASVFCARIRKTQACSPSLLGGHWSFQRRQLALTTIVTNPLSANTRSQQVSRKRAPCTLARKQPFTTGTVTSTRPMLCGLHGNVAMMHKSYCDRALWSMSAKNDNHRREHVFRTLGEDWG